MDAAATKFTDGAQGKLEGNLWEGVRLLFYFCNFLKGYAFVRRAACIRRALMRGVNPRKYTIHRSQIIIDL
uniref:Tnp_DDE_dom domain-containing protein n=1 Tax=Ascaris lumbricoides TaxID=6252 RepID=A0A0M3I7D6_ASCLU